MSAESEFRSLACDKAMSSLLSVATIRAPSFEPEDADKLPGMDVVAVIDRPGSVRGAKLEAVKKTIRMAAKHLRPQDRLALVTYDNAVERPLELTAMTESGKEKVVAAISALTDRGCTNLSGGLLEGSTASPSAAAPRTRSPASCY